jgi:hypothetical protein
MQFTGHTDTQGGIGAVHAGHGDRSLARLTVIDGDDTPTVDAHGTSFSFLQAVTHALHSMQRSASQRNFIRATIAPPYAARI